MDSFFNQVFTLLTSETGSLAYHLVLVFSILAALQISFNIPNRESIDAWTRLASGLGILLFLQLGLFTISGLGWQGIIDTGLLLPLLDRSVLLLSTLVIGWMWISDHPYGFADTSALLLGILIIIGSVLGSIVWYNLPSETTFNYSQVDILAQISHLILLLLVGVILAFRRPLSWIIGICMLGVMFLGSFLYLVLPHIQGDYSGAVRLSLIAAYPFLLYLPQRYQGITREQEVVSGDLSHVQPVEVERSASDAVFIQALPQLVLDTDADHACATVATLMARLANADLCLLAKVVEEESVVVFDCGYNQSKDQVLEKIAIPIQKLPLLVSSYRLGRVRKTKLQASSLDLVNLSQVFNLQDLGNVLLLPVLSPEGLPVSCVILLTPYSDIDWTDGEQTDLLHFAKTLVYLLQLSRKNFDLQEEIGHTTRMLRLVQEKEQLTSFERQKLLDQLSILQSESGQSAYQSLAVGAAVAGEASLFGEDKQSPKLIDRLEKPIPGRNLEQTALPAQEGGLRLALLEIIQLRSDLDDAESELAELQNSMKESSPGVVNPEILNPIVDDLNSSISSIIENSNRLSDDANDILDDDQRKYLERIKISTNRLSHIIDELISASKYHPESDFSLEDDLDLVTLVSDAVKNYEAVILEKDIQLEQTYPKKPIRLRSNAALVNSVFSGLLDNALTVSQHGGKVSIQIKSESAEGKPEYILVQIADSGEGISAEDIIRVFSPALSETSITGFASKKVDFPEIKAKVRALKGKIWVDSEPGFGAVFSIILPGSPQDLSVPPVQEADQ